MKFSSIHMRFLLFIIIYLTIKNIYADELCSPGWVAYKDLKCYRILDNIPRTFDEAQKACVELEEFANSDSLTLPSQLIKDEYEFLINYLFNQKQQVDNFWIDIHLPIDKGSLDTDFTNWDLNRKKYEDSNYCVQIEAGKDVQGKWVTAPCASKAMVVCQKMQSWSLTQLQKSLLKDRNRNEELQKKYDETINELKTELKQYKNLNLNNPVSFGFIYVQFQGQLEPSKLWSKYEWIDVSDQFEKYFFSFEDTDDSKEQVAVRFWYKIDNFN